jgi:TonB family protein
MHQGPAFAPPCACASKNHEQGVVLLKVLVGADGSAHKVEADADNKASPELTKAASNAAIKWHYPPKQESSKTAEAWVKVPVLFSLALLPPHPPGPRGELPPPPGAPMPPPPGQPSSPNS